MSIEQPRTPAGSPEGGQFAGLAGAESSAALATAPEPIDVVLCVDCMVKQENESPDPDYSNNSTCEACHEDGIDCVHDGHADDDFSSTPCAKCGSTLTGTRHHYAYWGATSPDAPESGQHWIHIERQHGPHLAVGPYPSQASADIAMEHSLLVQGFVEDDALDCTTNTEAPRADEEQVLVDLNDPHHTGAPVSTIIMRSQWGSNINPDGSGTITLKQGAAIELAHGDAARLVRALKDAADEDYEYDMRDEWESEHHFGRVMVTVARNDNTGGSSLIITRHDATAEFDASTQTVADFDSPIGARRLANHIAEALGGHSSANP